MNTTWIKRLLAALFATALVFGAAACSDDDDDDADTELDVNTDDDADDGDDTDVDIDADADMGDDGGSTDTSETSQP